MTAEDKTKSGSEAQEAPRRSGFRPWMVIPLLGAFAVLSTFLLGLGREDADVLPSPLIDRPAPEFALEGLGDVPGFSTEDLRGSGVTVVNVWASWCVPCRHEHPWIEALAKEGHTVYGINYKDDPANAQAFLDELGNPYERIGVDGSGRVGIDWGVYGVPETFVVDGEGRIAYKHVGPIQAGDLSEKILPAIERAAGRGAGEAPAAAGTGGS
jgi:cytochrome c biogenesis protein CcmG/thiol:disulfide interchange protein DsbE